MFSQLATRHHKRRFAALGAVAILGVPALAACGTSNAASTTSVDASATPLQQVDAAFKSLSKGSSLTMTLRSGASETQLLKLRKSGIEQLTPTVAKELAGGELSFAEHATSGTLANAGNKNSAVEVRFVEQGTQLIDVRYLNSTFYAQAHVKQLLALFGQPAAVFGNLQAEVSHLPTFVKALLTGKYISLPTSDLSSLLHSTGTSTGSKPTTAQQQKLMQALTSLFTKDVKVTRLTTSSNGGTYVLTANSRTLVQGLLQQFKTVDPAMSSMLRQLNTAKIPSQTVKLGLTISSGTVSQVSLDVAQFAGKADGLSSSAHLPLDFDFSTAATAISAPTGTTSVNLSQLQGLLSLVGGSSASSSA